MTNVIVFEVSHVPSLRQADILIDLEPPCESLELLTLIVLFNAVMMIYDGELPLEVSVAG